jgi:hypothetical protein
MSEPEIQAGEPPATGPAAPSGAVSEEEAWAAVLAAWGDEAAHRAYLARFADIEGLAVAGGRYKGVLDARPDDAMALRMRGEVLKKATVYGLAALPRTPPPAVSRTAKRLRMMAALSFGGLAVWSIYKLVVLLGARS